MTWLGLTRNPMSVVEAQARDDGGKLIFHRKMNSAVERCINVYNGEKLMGYKDSARAYEEMIDEIRTLSLWFINTLAHQEETGSP